MRYRLKKGVENFQVVSGKLTGRKFERDGVYEAKDIPDEEKGKFEKAPEPAAQKDKPKKVKGASDA